jgi:DNA-binding response OmpR family regulator
MIKILIVDDESLMRDLLRLFLEPEGFECVLAKDGSEALEAIKQEQFQVVLLDVMMPSVDGFEICKIIHHEYPSIPIIMITALDDPDSIVRGFNAGAVDYITKPFNGSVLLVRINSVIKRFPNSIKSYDGLTVDVKNDVITLNTLPIGLTPKANGILRLFLTQPNRIFSRMELYDLVWAFDAESDPRTVDSHIKMIRERLRELDFPIDRYLKTIWGRGYRWIDINDGDRHE